MGVWHAVKGDARCPVIAANVACRIMIKAKGTHCSPSDPLCSECARRPQSTVCLSAMSRLDISAVTAPLCYSKKQEGACCADSFYLFIHFFCCSSSPWPRTTCPLRTSAGNPNTASTCSLAAFITQRM